MKTGSMGLVALLGVLGCASAGSGDDTNQGPLLDASPFPDAPGEVCVKEPCDILTQCGCDGATVCDLDSATFATAGTECRDVTAPGRELSGCNAVTGCAGGYSCFGNPGQCRLYCDSDTDCGPSAFCRRQVVFQNPPGSGNFEDVPGAVLCTKRCAPERSLDNGCPEEFACRVNSATDDQGQAFAHTDCEGATGGGTHGADCSANGRSDCAPAFTCIIFSQGDTETSRECRQQCRLPDGACGTGTCQRVGDAPLGGQAIDGVEYGICN
jgi:hypothetical protein